MKPTSFAPLVASLSLAVFLGAGCSSSVNLNTNDQGIPSSTPDVTATSTETTGTSPMPSVTSTPATSTASSNTQAAPSRNIRDFYSAIQTLVKNDAQVKQTVAPALLQKPLSILYQDVTNDNKEDAIVFIDSDGTAGTIEIVIASLVDGHPKILQRFTGQHLAAHADNGNLVILEPRYLPTDPNASPTYLVSKVYAWNGAQFALKSQEEQRLK